MPVVAEEGYGLMSVQFQEVALSVRMEVQLQRREEGVVAGEEKTTEAVVVEKKMTVVEAVEKKMAVVEAVEKKMMVVPADETPPGWHLGLMA